MALKMERTLRHLAVLGKRWCAGPGQAAGRVGWFLLGLFTAPAGLFLWPMPIAPGLIGNLQGGKAVAAALGAALGSWVFWGEKGLFGVFWAAAGGAIALSRPEKRLRPVLAAMAVSAVALGLRLSRGLSPPVGVFLLQAGLAALSGWVFSRPGGLGNRLTPVLLGLTAGSIGKPAGICFLAAAAVGGPFPAAVLAAAGAEAALGGTGLTAAVSIAWLGRLLPVGAWRACFPAVAFSLLGALKGEWSVLQTAAALGGGILGLKLPAFAPGLPQRGATGRAQVRLELTATAMLELRRQLLLSGPEPIDTQALLQRLRNKTCGSCPLRPGCLEQRRLTETVLLDSHSFACRRPSLLKPELERTRERLRLIKAERRRREEYRQALAGQYLFFGEYLRLLADRLPRQEEQKNRYRVKIGIRTRSPNGRSADRWAAFRGSAGRYYVLLCDGMGTGEAGRAEGTRAAALLRQLLTATVPPEYALRSVNAMLVLTGRPGAVTVDLAELRLDTGQARLYKWGAAPSWWIHGGKAEKIGTALPPPGLSVTARREWTARLSLKRGETLILISDGVDGEDVPRRVYMAPDAPPGELAERLLEGRPEQQDDATAAVIRLCSGNLAPS